MNLTALALAVPYVASQSSDGRMDWPALPLLLVLASLVGVTGYWASKGTHGCWPKTSDVGPSSYVSLEEVANQVEIVLNESDLKRTAAEAAAEAKEAAWRAHRQALLDLQNAELEARRRYSQALDLALAGFRAEAEADEAMAIINHKEAQRIASAAYNRDLLAYQKRARATAAALWEAGAPDREYQAAQAEAEAQHALLVQLEHAGQAAEAARQVESVVARAAKMAGQRAAAHIREQRRAYTELMSLADSVQPDGKPSGDHRPVKPPLPRCRTVARSHVYGSPGSSSPLAVLWTGRAADDGEIRLADGTKKGVTKGASPGSSGRFAGVKPVRTPSTSTLERMQLAKLRWASGGVREAPRDVNNLFPHATTLEAERGPYVPEDGGFY